MQQRVASYRSQQNSNFITLRREEIVSTLMYLIKLVKSTVLNVLTYLKVEQYTTKEMKCKGDYLSR